MKRPKHIERIEKIIFEMVTWRRCFISRRMALRFQKVIVKEKGFTSVNRHVKKQIKAYCNLSFGSASYWPWLATYTELRGKFIPGWTPNDYFFNKIFPKINTVATSHISVNKSFDHRIFGDLCLKPLLIIFDKLLFDGDFNRIDIAQAYKLINETDNELVIKKDGGSGGHQVRFVRPEKLKIEEITGHNKYIIQPVVKQHSLMAALYPLSVNTFRILTYIDSESCVKVKAVILVIGSGGARVNNGASGGRYAYLGDDGKPVTLAYRLLDGVPLPETTHPDTGFIYDTICLPFVVQAKELCIKAHYRYPYAGFVGWDVYIDEDGDPKILEWNARFPTFWIHEAIAGPFFEPGEIKKRSSLLLK